MAKILKILASIPLFFGFGSTAGFGAAVAVTTYHYDLNRTGANLNETVLTASNVNAGSFGKLFSLSVDGQIYAQPLYVPALNIPGQGVRNVVFVATEHNSVYSFNADSGGSPLWHVNLGPTAPSATLFLNRDLKPEVGISSTPVIDLTTNTIYVVAETYEVNKCVFRLHALDITTGAEKFGGPVVISGSVPGTGAASVGGVLAFDPMMNWQRAGLALWKGTVYIAFGSHQDTEPYHGWVYGYNASTLARTALRCLSPNADSAGVWQGGVGLLIDPNGFMYVQTGHGTMNAHLGGSDHGDSVVKLDTANGLAAVDFFSPSNQEALSGSDIDFGSSGPILIPGTPYIITDGKDGKLFLLNSNNLGGYNATDKSLQEWQATYSLLATGAGGFFSGNVYYNSTLYAWGRRDTLKAYKFNGSTFNTTPMQGTFAILDGYSNEPAMAVSANGTTPGTGILWTAYSATGSADGLIYPGIFHAFDASNVTKELWNSNQNVGRDYSGSYAKWCSPLIANGRVYLATFDNVVNVYGLLTVGSGGSIVGSGNSSATPANLTTEGTGDWVHWGDASLNRKAGVTAKISNYSVTGAGSVGSYNNDPRFLSWADGAPTASSTNNPYGVYINGAGNGLLFTVPADTTSRTLVVHVGGWNSGGTFGAHLSDNSASDYLDTTVSVNGAYDRNYTLSYHAASPGQTLTVTWKMMSGIGNVTLSGAALTGAVATPASIVATAGTPQSAVVGTAFATALQATVKDTNGALLSGVQVKFTAPAGGATGAFGDSQTATATTNASGAATAPTFVANNTVGGYTVVASVTGLATTASFGLTNSSASPATITATVGMGQSTAVNTSFPILLQATVKAADSSPVVGAVVTFTPPGSGASGAFAGGVPTKALTNTSGVATAPVFSANLVTGSYAVTATVTGVATAASFGLTNTVGATGGSILGASTAGATAVNLTTEGTRDWIHWGDASLIRKVGVAAQLTTYTVTGSGSVLTYNSDPRPITWSDGTPIQTSANNFYGIYINGSGNGFSFKAPADRTTRKFIVHAGGWNSSGTLTAHLSDGSSPDYVETTVSVSGQYNRNYTLIYRAASAGQTLTVTWKMAAGSGNVTLNGAALATLGSLTGSGSSSISAASLTTEGTTDWIHWGDTALNRKATLTPVIATYTVVGSGAVSSYKNDPRPLAWTDGTPNQTSSNNQNGVFINAIGNGFSFKVPADTSVRTLTVHAGGYISGGTLTAHLSDGSASDFTDSTGPVSTSYDRNYTLIYGAASAGQTLTVTWKMSSGSGNVTLNGAALK